MSIDGDGQGSVAPLTAFSAALVALAGRDEEINPAELAHIERVVGGSAVMAMGRDWLATHGLEALLEQLPLVLDGQQRGCLYANLVAVALANGHLTEEDLLHRFSGALKLHADDVSQLEDGIKVLQGRADLFRSMDDQLLFGAALMAMVAADDETKDLETSALATVLGNADLAEQAHAKFEEEGMDGVMGKLMLLTRSQKTCLLANLMALMLADGEWAGSEQRLVEQFAKRMFISEADCEKMMTVVYTKFHFAVPDENEAGA